MIGIDLIKKPILDFLITYASDSRLCTRKLVARCFVPHELVQNQALSQVNLRPSFIAEFAKVQNPVSSANRSDMLKRKYSLEFHTLLLMVQKS